MPDLNSNLNIEHNENNSNHFGYLTLTAYKFRFFLRSDNQYIVKSADFSG